MKKQHHYFQILHPFILIHDHYWPPPDPRDRLSQPGSQLFSFIQYLITINVVTVLSNLIKDQNPFVP